MKVVINTGIGGLRLNRYALEMLFKHHPAQFDTFDHEPFLAMGKRPLTAQEGRAELEGLFSDTAIVTNDKIYFIKIGNEIRCSAWLVAQIEKDAATVAPDGDARGLKAISIPDDVQWHIVSDDDGSESIHEDHRVWQ